MVAAAYGRENVTCFARSGVIASEATSMSTLSVSRNGMRFGPVTGHDVGLDAESLASSLATSAS